METPPRARAAQSETDHQHQYGAFSAAPQHSILRPYQRDALREVRDALVAGKNRLLLVAPTGSGKTVIAVALIEAALARGKRVLFLAHRRELVRQCWSKLYEQGGIDAGIIQAGYEPRPGQPVQIASIATLWARAFQRTKIERPRADLVVVDEAHHIRARSWLKILEAYQDDARIIGLTATPCRGDGRGLGNVFERLVECPQIEDLIELGFLVRTRVYAPSTPDLTGVQTRLGDYVETQLAGRMDTPKLVGDIVEHWHRLAERRPTVVFASGVAHSVHIRDEFRKSGVLAEHIDGTTPTDERDAILTSLSKGEVELVTNCMVLTEGWDQPSVSCIVLARPTKHMGLYRQMIGRVLRPAPGKTDALVIDHAGATWQHGLVEEAVNWTLDQDQRAVNPTHAAREQHQAPKLSACPKCSAVRTAGKPCPACGWHPKPKAEPVEVASGELARFGQGAAVWSQEQRAQFHSELAWIAEQRGWKPGYASIKYKERFGSWPSARSVEPTPPSPATLSWVRSRQIAWAKRRRAA